MVKMVYTVRRYRKRPEARFTDTIDPDDDDAFKTAKDLMFSCLADGEDLLFIIRERIREKGVLIATLLEGLKPTLERLTAEIEAAIGRIQKLQQDLKDGVKPVRRGGFMYATSKGTIARERDKECGRYLALRAQVAETLAPITAASADIEALEQTLEAEAAEIEEEQSAVLRYYYLQVFDRPDRRQHEREVIKVPFVLHL